jgi:hypothetical protein
MGALNRTGVPHQRVVGAQGVLRARDASARRHESPCWISRRLFIDAPRMSFAAQVQNVGARRSGRAAKKERLAERAEAEKLVRAG